MQNNAGTLQDNQHKISTVCSGDVLGGKTEKPPEAKENPGALAGATGANIETASFLKAVYSDQDAAATPFKHISTAALRIAHLASRHGLTAERAALLAPLIFEGGRV